jgi:ATP-dependent DNA helicase RecG
MVYLWNHNRPSLWQQVSDYIDRHGSIGNAEVRRLMGTDDTLGISKQLKHWVDQGLLVVANPHAGRNVRRCTKTDLDPDTDFFSKFDGKEDVENA